MRCHRALALERVRKQRLVALADARSPCNGIAELRRAGDAGAVTSDALGGVDLVAGFHAARVRQILDFDMADRRDAARHRFGGQRVGAGGRLLVGGDEAHQQHDRDDRHDEREEHRDDQLSGRLDRPGVRAFVVVGMVGVAHEAESSTRRLKCRKRACKPARGGRRKSR